VSSLKTLAAAALVCLGSISTEGQSADQLIAARILGPQWKHMARTAGVVFSGTVLGVESQPATGAAVPTIQLRFKVDRAIVGVRSGQVLTVHEWAGAWSMHRPMLRGEHLLLFLYPPSNLGLTSPVNGPSGQVVLDSSGAYVAAHALSLPRRLPDSHLRRRDGSPPSPAVSVLALERAVRSAREE
jgi:hypothetical protein